MSGPDLLKKSVKTILRKTSAGLLSMAERNAKIEAKISQAIKQLHNTGGVTRSSKTIGRKLSPGYAKGTYEVTEPARVGSSKEFTDSEFNTRILFHTGEGPHGHGSGITVINQSAKNAKPKEHIVNGNSTEALRRTLETVYRDIIK